MDVLVCARECVGVCPSLMMLITYLSSCVLAVKELRHKGIKTQRDASVLVAVVCARTNMTHSTLGLAARRSWSVHWLPAEIPN